MTEPKLKEIRAFINPSYDRTQTIKTRISDFLGKYHIILNGVVAHERFDLRNEGKPEEQCDTSDKKEIIEFVELLCSQLRQDTIKSIEEYKHDFINDTRWDLSVPDALDEIISKLTTQSEK